MYGKVESIRITMSEYDRTNRSHGDRERRREEGFERWTSSTPRRQSDHLHSDYRNRANMSSRDSMDFDQRDRNRADRYAGQYGRTSYNDINESAYAPPRHDNDHDVNGRNIWTRSVDEVRSWFGNDEAERRRLRDEEERMRNERYGVDSRYSDEGRYGRDSRSGWNSSRGYGSDLDRDYGRNDGSSMIRQRTSRSDSYPSTPSYFRSSNEYGGSRNRDFYRDYPTHNAGRSFQNNEDDEMKWGYERQSGQSSDSDSRRMFGGRDYERNYPTRAERNADLHEHDFSGGWQSNDSNRGYRSLNNTGRTGIGQDNRLGKDRDTEPNYQDQNYSRGDYTPNLNAGGQEYDSRHYEQRGRPGTAINEQAQRGYSQGYGRTGYSLTQPSGNYANAETRSTRQPKNYKGTDDRIYVEVCEALGRELDASDIEVKAAGSEITLTGTVNSREEKRRAERIAERIYGVEDVHNQLTVRSDSLSQSSNVDAQSTTQGNSSRTDLSTDGSSQTESRAADGANGSGRTSSSNGSGKNARK
jgi:hypothetical protein